MILKDRVALVTGASRGIGAATAKILAKQGASVIVNYHQNQKAADEVVKAITDSGGRAVAIQADCRDREQVDAMARTAVEQLGPVDILILNAGMPVPFKPFAELSFDEFEGKVMGELKCFFYPLKAVLPGMIERKSGCIVGISSGLSRTPGYGFSAHTTVKSGVDGLMKSLAFELGPMGIRVNTVAPGLTETDATSWLPPERFQAAAESTPLRRVGQPEDIAGAVLMVVSDDAGFLTGNYISASGGTLMV
jgi:3-oxoacyl-[acyl-carrier protein] reductase